MRGVKRARVALVFIALASGSLMADAAIAAANPFGSPAQLSDPQSAALGQSVSVSSVGTVAVVGEPEANAGAGAAAVYEDSDGAWSLVQRLTPTGELGDGRFGAAVSMDGSGQALIVGAPDDDGGVGAAWTFAISDGVWSQQGELLARGETGPGQFGASVAIASGGMLALVGAPMSDAGEGQVFTFDYDSSDGWYFFQHMDRSGVSGAARFGASVALSNNAGVALVGAPGASSGDGAVYPFGHYYESPLWIDGNEIQSPAPGSGEAFGSSVAVSFAGQLLVIGAPLGGGGPGAAYLYTRSGLQQAAFSDPSASTGGGFGTSVAIAGMSMDQVVVGAPADDDGTGAVYDFDNSHGGDWLGAGAAVLPGTVPQSGDGYGTSVAISADGSTAFAGAPGADDGAGAITSFTSSAYQAPGPPVSVQATAGDADASVTWSAPDVDGGSAITGYTVTSSPGALTCTTTSQTCTVEGLTDGHTYTFTVNAANKSGTSSPSMPSIGVTPQSASGGGGRSGSGGGSGGGASGGASGGGASGGGAGVVRHRGAVSRRPSAPGGPLRAVRRRTSLTLSWRATTGGVPAAGYRIYDEVNGAWQQVGRTSAAIHSFVCSDLRRSRRYRFEVRAYDLAGDLSSPLTGVWVVVR